MKLSKQKKELKKIRAPHKMIEIHSEEYNLDVLFDCDFKNYSITVYVNSYKDLRATEKALERIRNYIAEDFAYWHNDVEGKVSLTYYTLQSIQFMVDEDHLPF